LPLATVDRALLEMVRKVREAWAALEASKNDPPPPPFAFGDPTDVGVEAEKAVFDLDIEDFDPANPVGFGAKYTVSAESVRNLSYIHISYSYDGALFESTYDLPAALKLAGFVVDGDYPNPTKTVKNGKTVVSLYLHTPTPIAPAATGPVDILEIYLYPKDYLNSYTGTSSVGLGHIDITYNGNGAPVDADVDIVVSVAAAWINYFSRYDINRDGKVTLADVDLVRRNMGKTSASPDWGNPLVHRCDVAIPKNNVIDMADLLTIIAAYEATL
jgi:hypothetical protein